MIRAVAGVVAVLALGVGSAVGAHGDDVFEVKVSKLVNGRCGHLEGSLPALVTRNGLSPGEVAADVTICVANAGDRDAVLGLGATELVELDPRCTGSEREGDLSCGEGRRGELGPSLLQQVGIGSCPAVPADTSVALDRRLTDLEAAPLVVLPLLRAKELACVRLRLRYDPADSTAARASQSDRTFWRYALTLTMQ